MTRCTRDVAISVPPRGVPPTSARRRARSADAVTRPPLTACVIALFIALHPGLAQGARLEVSAAAGRSRMTITDALGSTSTGSTAVFREALGVSFRVWRTVRLGAEVAWAERGGGLPARSFTFLPFGGELSPLDRNYAEILLVASAALNQGRWGFELGVAPRLSVLTREPSVRLGRLVLRDTLLGLDPVLSVSYDQFFLTARYAGDLQSSYDSARRNVPSEIRDSTWYLGAGIRLGS